MAWRRRPLPNLSLLNAAAQQPGKHLMRMFDIPPQAAAHCSLTRALATRTLKKAHSIMHLKAK